MVLQHLSVSSMEDNSWVCQVSMDFMANTLLAIGASPAMVACLQTLLHI